MGGIYDRVDSFVVAPLMGAAMLAAWWVGRQWGKTLAARGRELSSGKLEDASIALLGLLLAFTFSMSIAKHDRRREMVVADSNAIGDFYTCASLQDEPVRSRLQTLLREYTELRLELARSARTPAALEQTLERFEQMHGRMTDLVGQALKQGTPIAAPLTNTLNEVTSNYSARLAAVRDRLPPAIVALLLLAGLIAAFVVGRQQGASRADSSAGTLSFVLLVTLVVWVTLDLNQPYRGMMRVSQAPMERLLSSMKP